MIATVNGLFRCIYDLPYGKMIGATKIEGDLVCHTGDEVRVTQVVGGQVTFVDLKRLDWPIVVTVNDFDLHFRDAAEFE